jgi:mono/diheme cytochrome c family protein
VTLRLSSLILTALVADVCALSAVGRLQSNATMASKESKAESVYSEISKAPEKARAKRNPLEKDSDAIAAGRVLFEQRCAECHGHNAEGGKKGPSLRATAIQNAEPGAIFWILTNGVVRKGMPVWSKLPEPQRWQLVSFIKSLGPAPARTETPPANPSQPPATKDSLSRPR